MGVRWRPRGTYGSILYRKIKKQEKIFNTLFDNAVTEDNKIDVEKLDMNALSQASRDLDYSMQVQLSNINKAEELELEEIMEADKRGKHETEVQRMEEGPLSQRKF